MTASSYYEKVPLFQTISPSIQDASVPLRTHLAYFWETEEEFAQGVCFLEVGFRGSDHCVIFGHDEANERVRKVLSDRGFDAEALQSEGRLTVLGGDLSADAMLNTIAAAFERALAGGAPLIRLLGNIGWQKKNWPDDRDLLAFEAKVTEAIKQFPCVVVCMYDLRALSGQIAHHGGFETHPFVARGGLVVENPHHVPTDIFLSHVEDVAAAIAERARTEEALRKSEERRRLLLEINNAIITKLTRDELFSAICEALGRVIAFDRVALSLYDAEANVLRLVTYSGPYQSDYSPIGRVLELKDSPVGWAFLHQKPCLRRDLETERRTASEERTYGHGFRSLCALPLVIRGKSIGTITVGSLKRFQYTDADAEFLMEVANQIAIAIDNMQSYEDLRRISGELGVLVEVNRAIGRHLERDALFGALAGCLEGLLRTNRFGIEIPLGDDKLQGHLLRPGGGSPQPTEPHVLPAAGTACHWVIQNRQWFVAASRDELRERFPETFRVMVRERMESLCAMPLLIGANCRGVLFCMAAEEGAYGELPQGLLEKVAVAVAVALDNSLAHEEVRRLRDRLAAENVYLQEEIKTEYNFEEIIGQSVPVLKLLRKVEQVAPTETTVLIHGETGTGKELLARALHNLSPRKERPLVKVNCGAIPAGLVESELFGHEKGAFTGATQRRIGRFELANGGTIFLDEVAELPLDTQVRLLRALQEGEFERVGSSQTIKVDVRVIAATNRDLKEAVKNGSFRSDLFYRLSVFPLEAPPLRERGPDIPLLVNFFLSKCSKKLGKEIQGVSKETMDRLGRYPWPGNIRELQNVIERAVVTTEGPIMCIDESALRVDAAAQDAGLLTLEDVERTHIVRALKETGWLIHGAQGAASILGINPSTLRSRMQKLGIKKPARPI